MRNSTKTLSVVERIDAVLTLHEAENPGAPLSVSDLARRAKVSRANLYTSHKDIVQRLARRRPESQPRAPITESVGGDEELRAEVCQLRRANKALLLINAHLNQEVASLNRRLANTKIRR